jgi:hypothetical protein
VLSNSGGVAVTASMKLAASTTLILVSKLFQTNGMMSNCKASRGEADDTTLLIVNRLSSLVEA